MNINYLLEEMTLEEKASICSGSDFWNTQSVERLGIDSVMMCDGPNGLRKQDGEGDHLGINESIKAVCFPTSSAVAASFDRELAGRIGEILGNECQAENVSMLLGPGVNIKRSPLCGRNFEYYSEDPYLTGELATAYIIGIQSKGVAACLKHFAANNQETRRMNGDSIVSRRTLHEIYLAAFEKAVKEAKPGAMMCAYNKLNGVYAAENGELLNDILRDKWGFKGLVVTDWGAVKDRVKGICAGLDLEMPGGAGSEGNDKKIVRAVLNGDLPMSVLDLTVSRILTLVSNYMMNRKEEAIFDRKKDYREAVQASVECAVLLKNDQDVLPLEVDKKIVFIGAFAEKPRYQGSGSSYINSTKTTSALEAVEGRSNISYAKGFGTSAEECDEELLQEAIDQAKEADCAVIFAGLPDTFESEGVDRKHLELPQNQNKLIEEISKVQENVVVVLHNGAPITMPWVDKVSAILEMYLGGDGVGEACVSLLFGETTPSGKLAETFPLKLEDNPSYLNFPGEKGVVEYNEGIYVGYRYYDKKSQDVLFPFGHGLSYTAFEYSNLQIEKKQITEQEQVSITLDVTNIGNYPGKEVVQLYINTATSEVRRPIRELKGFEKVELNPGETKSVKFVLDKQAFAYYEPAIQDWFVESGTYRIEIGSSSRDLRLNGEIIIDSTMTLPVTYTRESTIGEIMRHPVGMDMVAGFLQAGEQLNEGVALGEGSAQMAKNMIMEMPLGALHSHSMGVFSEEQLEGMIRILNSKEEQ